MKNTALAAPEWLARSAVYQVNPRTFSKDGTIKAVTEELPYLKSIGFNIVYLCPVFEEDDSTDINFWSERQKASETNNPKNPYRMNDYFAIDEEYGTVSDLKELIDKAHALDMRVLLDLVYAHIGPNAPVIKKHPEFIKQNPDGSFITTNWHFPELDFKCEGLREYLYCNMTYFIGVCDADGFRCDVGDHVPVDFWKEARRRIKAIKPDSVLINEGSKYENMAIAFDSCYTFPWHTALYSIFCEGESAKTLSEVWGTMHDGIPEGSVLLCDMDNHDTVTDWPARIETTVTHDGMEQILVMNYMIDGIPMVYTGNELACTARLSMFANRFHPGAFEVTDRNRKTAPEAVKRQEIIKELNKLKSESDVLRFGSTVWQNSDCDSIISFKRCFENNEIIFIGNSKNSPCEISMNTVPEKILFGNNSAVSDGKLSLEPYGYVVFSN